MSHLATDLFNLLNFHCRALVSICVVFGEVTLGRCAPGIQTLAAWPLQPCLGPTGLGVSPPRLLSGQGGLTFLLRESTSADSIAPDTQLKCDFSGVTLFLIQQEFFSCAIQILHTHTHTHTHTLKL